ncbi:legume-like lectin family-domain-containing protein [Dichotomocladium elegans]|nr:legume-like lectin family-domain-containing protein [Dichotomocladium elegans]
MRFITAILAVAFSVVSTTVAQPSVMLRTHSISMPYIDDELQNRWFDFGGDAVINTNKQVRLASAGRQSQQGYLWSRLPLTATNFEIEFEFKVGGQPGTFYGDGFAMWLTKQRSTLGPVFGSMDNFDGLGIFFDTYDNERAHRHTFPYISAMLGDGTRSYQNAKDGSTTELTGCEAQFRSKSYPTKARLTYYKDNYLQLDVIWREEDQWDQCFLARDVKLPDQIYLGFSAHTGDVTDNHDIISVTTKTLAPKAKEPLNVPVSKKGKSSSGGFLLKLLGAGVLVGVFVFAYRLYDNNSRMKRF